MTERLLVTDTHPLIFFFCDGGKKLGAKARQAFTESVTNRRTIIFVPIPVLWELAMLVEDDAIRLSKSFSDWIDELFAYPAINPCPFDIDTIKEFYGLDYHNDPFDRSIVATARQMDLPLITNDRKMHEHKPCELFWD